FRWLSLSKSYLESTSREFIIPALTAASDPLTSARSCSLLYVEPGHAGHRLAGLSDAAGVSAQATDVTLTPSPPILALRPPVPPRPPSTLERDNASATPLLLTFYGLDMWSLVHSWGSGIQALLEAQQPPSLSLQGLSAPGMCASQLLALNTTALLNTSLTAQELMPGLAYFTADDSSITVQVIDLCAGNRTFASFTADRTLV
ncbi:hypothetical protein HaLaN_16011, partial [Haematococcus lacustris]